MSILKQLYRGEISPWDWQIPEDYDYKTAQIHISERYDELNETLSKNQKRALERLINAYDESDETEKAFYFINVFKLGVSIILEAIM